MSLTGLACKSGDDGWTELSAPEWDQGIFGQRGAVGAIRGSGPEKGFKQFTHHAFRQIACDENQSCSVVVIRPAIKPRGRVENVLNAVHDNRCLGHFRELHDAFQPQELGPVRCPQQFQEHLERGGGDRIVRPQGQKN